MQSNLLKEKCNKRRVVAGAEGAMEPSNVLYVQVVGRSCVHTERLRYGMLSVTCQLIFFPVFCLSI